MIPVHRCRNHYQADQPVFFDNTLIPRKDFDSDDIAMSVRTRTRLEPSHATMILRNHKLKKVSHRSRAWLKGKGAWGNYHWRAPMTWFITSSFVKVLFSLVRKVHVCFFSMVENVLTQTHIGLSTRCKYWSVFLLRKNISHARELLGKKQHSPEQSAETRDYKQKHRKKNIWIWPARLSVNVVSKVMSWFSPSFSGAKVNATVLTLLLESC